MAPPDGPAYWWRTAGSTGLFPPESSPLVIDANRVFRRQSDWSIFQWRGYSWFLGFLRYCRAEDITPDLRWFRANGINIVRLFGPLPWVETPDYRYADFEWDRLPSFFDLLESWGIRMNWSLGHYTDPLMYAFVRRFYDEADGRWSILCEAVNEPQNGAEKPDPIDLLRNVDRHGILTAYGYYPNDHDPAIPPILDFGTTHSPRDSGWARKARDAQWLMNQTGRIWVNDEPPKIADVGFSGPGVKNDPTKTPAEMAWYAGVSCLWIPGCTIHTQAGRNGHVPDPGSLTQVVCDSVTDHVWLQIDPDWQTGGYMGSHLSASPVNHIPGVWTYSSMHPHEALSVRVAFSAPQPQNGWQVVRRWGPSGSFVELTR